MRYPDSRKAELYEKFFGKEVEDSYRWMEDGSNVHLGDWVDAQNELTHNYLNSLGTKDDIKKSLKDLFDYSKYRIVNIIGENIIYSLNDGLQSQGVYYIQKGLEGSPVVLIDPNELSSDGTVAVNLSGHSKDNRYLAYMQSNAGSDWQVIKVIDLLTCEVLEDELNWVKFTSISWKGNGFYYSAFDAPSEGDVLVEQNKTQKVFFHVLGTSQETDKVVYEGSSELGFHNLVVTKDEASLVLFSSQGTYGNDVKLLSSGTGMEFKTIFEGFDFSRDYIGSKDEYAYFVTDEGSENGRVIRVNTLTLKTDTIIPEAKHNIDIIDIVKDKLIVEYLEDVVATVKIFSLEGEFEGELELPGIGSPFGFVSSDSFDEIFYGFTSFNAPSIYYSFTLDDLKSKEYRKADLSFEPSDYVTEQIFTKSNDGTMVPSFVTYKRGIVLDGTNPTLLYAYGGFNVTLTPVFSPANMYLLQRGGIYVLANIRGGSEYGEAWHKDGMLYNKQNVFDDFISVAEDLIERKYTSKDHLAVAGGSNGGLLIGAVVNQRPDLFKVAFPAVGVMDMMRYHKFTIGWGWVVEYGNPEEETHFNNIIKYSPLHNIEKKHYPATMVLTADHDDRVVPAHSFKYIARLQELNTSNNPMLIRIDKQSGHGAGKSTEKWIDEAADKFAFMFDHIK